MFQAAVGEIVSKANGLDETQAEDLAKALEAGAAEVRKLFGKKPKDPAAAAPAMKAEGEAPPPAPAAKAEGDPPAAAPAAETEAEKREKAEKAAGATWGCFDLNAGR